jgi:hypothetical protein
MLILAERYRRQGRVIDKCKSAKAPNGRWNEDLSDAEALAESLSADFLDSGILGESDFRERTALLECSFSDNSDRRRYLNSAKLSRIKCQVGGDFERRTRQEFEDLKFSIHERHALDNPETTRKSKSAFRHWVSIENCSRKNMLFQAFNG